MAHLRKQFAEALGNVEPDDDDKGNAPEAHKAVREALEADPTLKSYGIDTVLIGSYKRNVSIKRVKDVDVFSRLPDLPGDITSQELLDHFFKVLNAAFGRDADGHLRTKRQARSLQVSFPEYDLYVDAVPARRHALGETWEIPQKGDEDAWVQTNPEELTTLSSEMNSAHEQYYVPTVKLLRQTRRAKLGKAKPGGFFVEVLAYNAFEGGDITGEDAAEYYTAALRAVSKIIDDLVFRGIAVEDPTLPGESVVVKATDDEFKALQAAFADAAATADSALADEDEGQAALKFRSLLGKDPEGEWIFPMPAGYHEDGTKRSSVLVSPGDRVVPAGRRTYG
ncbi:MAG: nucleotidyltransferase [Dehalococcoidia bacterium]|nr:nucleotidyltransferase [Dehalococcoidia bacterium]